ncbi:spore germination lipoprotein GerD [Oceanobacillus sp. FSL K6-0118]|uniref:spore germination lipoprotein GerD n=1 Tax=Oceanobacillus sp. FSL K6-0118 TaxID=2921418 RepID=UPI0030FAFDB3
MYRFIYVTIIGFCLLFLTACGGGGNASTNDSDYDQTKKMVIDILQTDEGKKALTDTLSDEKLKKEFVINSEEVKKAINETLVSDEGKKMWQEMFKDPKFAEAYAKSMEDSQKDLQKSLMNDSEYKQQMIDLLKDPQMMSHFLTVLKSQEFSSYLEKSIQKTIETPTFQAKIQEILLKAAEEQAKGQGGKNSSEGGGGIQEGGGSNEKKDGGGQGGGNSGDG